ncbi:Scr1 family TA system antitoxin-like transcriptional regulator [Nocardia violaceofusca]|uniref:Scr1 family TA system antitoxin-like transcriptional regulator n=1 Tax=Nocardia violaceofusca TaxID=941182 RepID=UPI00352E4E91
MPSQFVIIEFGTNTDGQAVEPPVVYLDGGMSSDIYLENEDDVRKYHELVEVIRQTALDETSTRNLLRQVAREHDGEC